MWSPLNRLALLLSFLFVNGVSAGGLGASHYYHSQSAPSLSFPANTSGAPAKQTTPFQGQSELEIDALRREVLRRNPTLAAMESACRAASSRYPQVSALDPCSLMALLPPP